MNKVREYNKYETFMDPKDFSVDPLCVIKT